MDKTREYAHGQNIRHVFLSNGNIPYYWDLESGNPTVISLFLSLVYIGEAGKTRTQLQGNLNKLAGEFSKIVGTSYTKNL